MMPCRPRVSMEPWWCLPALPVPTTPRQRTLCTPLMKGTKKCRSPRGLSRRNTATPPSSSTTLTCGRVPPTPRYKCTTLVRHWPISSRFSSPMSLSMRIVSLSWTIGLGSRWSLFRRTAGCCLPRMMLLGIFPTITMSRSSVQPCLTSTSSKMPRPSISVLPLMR